MLSNLCVMSSCHAVAAAWLEQPPAWRWPPQPDPPGDGPHSLETLFLPPHSPGSSGRPHWMRPGMLAFAAVTAAGDLRVGLSKIC